MGDSRNENGTGFRRPDGIIPLDHGDFFDQPDFALSSYGFLDQRGDMDFHSHYAPRIVNGPVQDDSYLQRGFYASGPNHLHGVMLSSAHSRHVMSDMNLGYSTLQHSDQHLSLQAPDMSMGFNGQATSQTPGQYDYIPFQYDLHENSHQNLTLTPVESQERDEDNESVGSATTDCDSDCELADPCTEESCADRDDACTDRHCPEKDCPDTNCPEKMPTEVVVAAATLAAFGGGPPPPQQSHDIPQGMEVQELSSSQQAFFDGMFGMASVKPLDIVRHIGMAHNDPASSSCTRPCLIDNPQVFQHFQHCPFPNSFDFQIDPYSALDNPFFLNSFNNDSSMSFPSHDHVGFEGCGAEISNPEALIEHFNSQHRHAFENVLAQGDAYGESVMPQISPRTLCSSSSHALEPSLSSAMHSPQGPFPPTPLSLCQDISDPSKLHGHNSRSSTVSQSGTGNDYEQQCLWCNPETGERCGRILQDSEALFAHVNEEHIQKLEKGAHGFLCHWENCKRRGDGKEGFPQRSKIERHMHTHIGRKPFECKSCGQRFSAQQALTQHLLIHSDEKPLRCDWEGCGKTFRQQSALTMHRRIHTGDKPLKCPVCGKAFSESSNLSKHKRIHETKGRFTCSEPGCNRSFHRLDQLRRHMKLHPPGDKKTKEEVFSGIDDLMSVLPSPLGNGELGQPTRKKRSR